MKLGSAVRSLMLALALALCFAPSSSAQINLSITVGPPPLPVYEQPVCPGDDYLWTPGYRGWRDGVYVFHEGYWGPRVGFYGGIDYGFGYGGRGYEGGRWDNGHFFYNRSVSNVNQTIVKNVYNTTVVNNTTINRISYNGGSGVVEARATTEEMAAERDRHIPPPLNSGRDHPRRRSHLYCYVLPNAGVDKLGGSNEYRNGDNPISANAMDYSKGFACAGY